MKASQFRYVSLSKRPSQGNKNKIKSFIPAFISSRKHTNFFQSPSRDDDLLIKKKFIKLSKNGKSTSSFLSFISSINNLYSNTKKHENNLVNKTTKNNNYLILSSLENSSIVNSKDIKINSINNSNNKSLNKNRIISNIKKTPESKYFYKNKNSVSSRTTTGANEKSKNDYNYSKTALNSKINSKEKDKNNEEKLKTYKKNKDKKLNEIHFINTIKSNCNSYRKSGKGGGGGTTTTMRGKEFPFSNKNILNSILSHLERPKKDRIHNNLNIRNIFDDFVKRAKEIKSSNKNIIKNISYNNNYVNLNNKKKKSENKNISINYKIQNLTIKSNYNSKISYTAKASPRCPLMNFNFIYKNRSKSKITNSSYRSAKNMHSSSRRKEIKKKKKIT